MHSAQILPFLGAPFERFDLFRVGWGGARGSRTALALYGAVLVFRALSPFARVARLFCGFATRSSELLPAHAQDAPVVAPAFA